MSRSAPKRERPRTTRAPHSRGDGGPLPSQAEDQDAKVALLASEDDGGPSSAPHLRAHSRAHLRDSATSLDAQDVYGNQAIANIARALPPVERLYAAIRFSILRPKLLSVMDLLLPERGRILDVGCGFGLFAAYLGQTCRARTIYGVDPDARRVRIASRVASRLGLHDHEFHAGDVRDVALDGPFDAAYLLDVMHHVPEADQRPVLERLRDLLRPGGTLLLKDITTEPRAGLLFTEYLDRLMVGWNEPLRYRHHREWGAMLEELGFAVRIVRVPDFLPYPHVVIRATKL